MFRISLCDVSNIGKYTVIMTKLRWVQILHKCSILLLVLPFPHIYSYRTLHWNWPLFTFAVASAAFLAHNFVFEDTINGPKIKVTLRD